MNPTECPEANREILTLWDKYHTDADGSLAPMVYPPPMCRRALLFIGLNPSFSDRAFKKILGGTDLASLDPLTFYRWRGRKAFDLKTAVRIEELARRKIPYFNKFRELAAHAGLPWEHVDLFFDRVTSQGEIRGRVFEGGALNGYGRAQLEISGRLVRSLAPAGVVVANALASGVFAEFFGARFSEELGCHTIEMAGREVPVFLGSMLSGQRAMDRFSYERLRWHVRRVCGR